MAEALEYGPVICINRPHKGRIGYFDDTDIDCTLCKEECCYHDCDMDIECDNCNRNEKEHVKCPEFAIVYWGNMLFCSKYSILSAEYCSNTIPMKELYNRIEILRNKICRIPKETKKKAELLEELEYAQTLFYEKHILTSFSSKDGKRLFISHSSKDKGFANCLYADLIEQGYNPWLDEWDIKAGQSIPSEIQKGLAAADYTLVLLSPHSVKSNWVTVEWETVFWDEINSRKTKVIPILLENCDIPQFLKTKKYVDFRENYQQGLSYLLRSL